MTRKTRKPYTVELKREAVRLVEHGGAKIAEAGKNGALLCTADITSSKKDGVEQTDMHGLRVRIK